MHPLAERIGRVGALCLVALGPMASPLSAETDDGAALEQARAAAGQLQQSLQQTLKDAIANGGPAGAVEACNLQALPLTDEVSAATGVEVGRTSLRVRNPKNSPDAWERAQLEDFLLRLENGEPVAALEAVRRDRDGIHVIKAIPMQKPCATCHGTAIEPELRARIDALYPEDAATGFEEGDLRGAFTVTIPMQEANSDRLDRAFRDFVARRLQN